MLRIRTSLLLLAPALLLFVAPPAAAKRIDREIRESFPLAEGDRLDLRSGDGDVSVEPWEKNELEIVVRYLGDYSKAGFSGGTDDFEAEMVREGRTIRAEGREPGGGFSFGFVSSRVEEYRWTVRAPAWLEIDLDGDDGDVRITGWRGRLDLRVDDGDVTLLDVSGDDLRLELEDGDLEVRRFEGALRASLDDGDIRLEECRGTFRLATEDGDLSITGGGGSFEIATDDGDLRVAELAAERLIVRMADGEMRASLTTPAPTVEVRTDDGDVDLRLPAEASVRLVLRSEDGGIDLDASVAGLARDERQVTGSLGGGEGEVRVETNGGRVRFEIAGR